MKTTYRIQDAKGRTLARNGKFYGSYTPTRSGGTVEHATEAQALAACPPGCKPQLVTLH